MNHYDMLEVSQKASPEVLKAAYKSLMQRHHPDKNLENRDAAARAGLITHAYDILSDATRRTAYDISISLMREPRAATHASGHSQTRTPKNRPAESNTKAPYLHFWTIIVITIIFSGGVYLYLLKNQSSRKVIAPAPNVAISAVERKLRSIQNGTGVEAYSQNQGIEDSSLTIRLASAMIVSLKDLSASQDGSRTLPARLPSFLTIPTILVQLGSSDSSEFIRYLDKNKLSIKEKLEERLAYASYDELLKTSGELYLRKFILDAVQNIAGITRFDTDPASSNATSGRYGVTGILLPESFSLK